MSTTRGCPDGGTCHHECEWATGCWRVRNAAPLAGVFPGDEWPARFPHPIPGMAGRPANEALFYEWGPDYVPEPTVATAPARLATITPEGNMVLLATEGTPLTAAQVDAIREAAAEGVVVGEILPEYEVVEPEYEAPRFHLRRQRRRPRR